MSWKHTPINKATRLTSHGHVETGNSMSASTPVSPEADGREATVAARSLSERLTLMKGRAPSISAIASKGDGKVIIFDIVASLTTCAFFQLVEKFLTETVGLEGDLSSGNTDSIQLYIGNNSTHSKYIRPRSTSACYILNVCIHLSSLKALRDPRQHRLKVKGPVRESVLHRVCVIYCTNACMLVNHS